MKHQVAISNDAHEFIKAIQREYKRANNSHHIDYSEIIDRIFDKAEKYEKIESIINDEEKVL